MIEKMKARAMTSEHAGGQGGTEYAILIAILVLILVAGLVIAAKPQMDALWNTAVKNLKDAATTGNAINK